MAKILAKTTELARFGSQGNGGKADDGVREIERRFQSLPLPPKAPLCFAFLTPYVIPSFPVSTSTPNFQPLHLFISPSFSSR
uniref:Uncharacterized protein n=1 Tax=Oryza punctata TaxID=4537 RepID=A0A0E0K0Z9_ORYPU